MNRARCRVAVAILAAAALAQVGCSSAHTRATTLADYQSGQTQVARGLQPAADSIARGVIVQANDYTSAVATVPDAGD